MCLSIWNKKKNFPVAQVATEDIVVYKNLHIRNKKLISPYYEHRYKIKECYTVDIPVPKWDTMYQCYVIEQGLHAYRKKYSTRGSNYLTYIAIIPKGSTYFMNRDEIVSNKLIITKRLV